MLAALTPAATELAHALATALTVAAAAGFVLARLLRAPSTADRGCAKCSAALPVPNGSPARIGERRPRGRRSAQLRVLN